MTTRISISRGIRNSNINQRYNAQNKTARTPSIGRNESLVVNEYLYLSLLSILVIRLIGNLTVTMYERKRSKGRRKSKKTNSKIELTEIIFSEILIQFALAYDFVLSNWAHSGLSTFKRLKNLSACFLIAPSLSSGVISVIGLSNFVKKTSPLFCLASIVSLRDLRRINQFDM
jgi:hypothetical protein